MSEDIQIVFIVDDDDDVRDSLVELIESVNVRVSAFESAHKFLEAFSTDSRGCVLADVRMPGMSGIELQHKLLELKVALPLIIMTGHGDITMAVQAMKDGAFEFLQKPFRDQELLDCVLKALEHDRSYSGQIQNQQHIKDRINTLTDREREVIDLVMEGKTNKVIARELKISDRTVEIHRSHAMEKLAVNSVAELVKTMLQCET